MIILNFCKTVITSAINSIKQISIMSLEYLLLQLNVLWMNGPFKAGKCGMQIFLGAGLSNHSKNLAKKAIGMEHTEKTKTLFLILTCTHD